MAYEILKPEWGTKCPIRGVLFDMDGIVLDSEILYSRFWREAAAFHGYTMSYEQSLKMRALNTHLGINMIYSFFGEDADYHTIRNTRIRMMEAFIQENGVEVKPGIFELMAYLKAQGIRTAITSSSPLPRIQSHLSRLGLDTAFDQLCSGHDMPNGKPAPDIYLHGAKVLGLKSEECLALEDAQAGILSAFRAGCLPVMIPDLDQPSSETKQLLYAKADSLMDIIHIIEAQKGHL
jgi:HAD superfamily hydrolase (TIGR01509 family)